MYAAGAVAGRAAGVPVGAGLAVLAAVVGCSGALAVAAARHFRRVSRHRCGERAAAVADRMCMRWLSWTAGLSMVEGSDPEPIKLVTKTRAVTQKRVG